MIQLKLFLVRTLFLMICVLSTLPILCQKNIDLPSYQQSSAALKSSKTLVIIGEAHEVKGTYGLELFIIKDFVKKGYHTLIIEAGISETALLNEYLETGNEKLLEYTRARGGNYKRFIKGIREIKQQNNQLSLKGVDFERAICLEFLFKHWFEKFDDPKLNQLLIELKNIKANTSPKKVKQLFLDLRKDYSNYEEALQASLPVHAPILRDIIFNPVFQADFGLNSKKRDEQITQNLLSIESSVLSKSILIFGSNHFTNPMHFWPAFSKGIKGDVDYLLFLFAYKNCTNYIRKKNYTSVRPLSDFVQEETETEAKISFILEKNEILSPSSKDHQLIIVKLLNQ